MVCCLFVILFKFELKGSALDRSVLVKVVKRNSSFCKYLHLKCFALINIVQNKTNKHT